LEEVKVDLQLLQGIEIPRNDQRILWKSLEKKGLDLEIFAKSLEASGLDPRRSALWAAGPSRRGGGGEFP
jgi:hypothetical protein